MDIKIIVKDVDSWKKAFPPAGGDKQWKDGYSAKELAKIVTGYYKDIDFEKELNNQLTELGKFSLNSEEIYPERLSKFDNDWHGPRHHDLACIAKLENSQKIALCFEAKVYEALDIKLDSYKSKSKGKEERCEKLCQIFFKQNYNKDIYGNLYYQILSGISGSIAFANENEINNVIFIVYQIKPKFNNDEKNPDKCIENHKKALNDFLKALGITKKIEKSGNIVSLGNFEIERKNKDGTNMNANVSIAYIEIDVSGN